MYKQLTLTKYLKFTRVNLTIYLDILIYFGFQMFGEIIKPLKKEVVVRSTKEELPKKHNVGVVKTNKLTEIKQFLP